MSPSGHVYIASANYVWRLSPTPITLQIKQLLTNKEFELALHLAVSNGNVLNVHATIRHKAKHDIGYLPTTNLYLPCMIQPI